MPAVIFDFDSTLIICESLEKILETQLAHQPEVLGRIREITELGIRGKMSFADSLAQRLALAAPTRSDAEAFGRAALELVTPGMEPLVRELQQGGVDVWIVSGGIQESLEPVGAKMGIPSDRIHGVRPLWDAEGRFAGFDAADPFSVSKLAGVQSLATARQPPTIAVGDAMSDYRLYEEGVVSHFILFTEHFQCQEVRDKGVMEAKDATELRGLIQEIFKDYAFS